MLSGEHLTHTKNLAAINRYFPQGEGRTDERMAHKNSQNKVLKLGNGSRERLFQQGDKPLEKAYQK